MRRFNLKRNVLLSASLGGLVLMASCGGGGGGGSPPPPAPTISVSVSPASVSLTTNQSTQFTATVTGTSDTAVTWSVNGLGDEGTITPSMDPDVATYTAPASVPSTNPVSVVAISRADTTKSAIAKVTVLKAAVTVTISPSPATVIAGESLVFIAAVDNAIHSAVTWSVNGVVGGNAVAGTIVDSGIDTATYTAPSTIPPNNPVTVTATSQEDTSRSGSTNVTIVVSPADSAQRVTVTAGMTTSGVNFSLKALTPKLQLVGLDDRFHSISTGVILSTGGGYYVTVVGNGLAVPGTAYFITGNDIGIIQPTSAGPCTYQSGSSSVTFSCAQIRIQVPFSATPGLRSIMVTNSAGELAVLPGAVTIQ